MSGLATAVGAPSSPLPVFRSAVGNPFDRPYTAWQFGMAPSSEDADPLLEHLLLRRALQGDDKAFVALASMHSAAVYATARNLSSSDLEAVELPSTSPTRLRYSNQKDRAAFVLRVVGEVPWTTRRRSWT